MKTSFILVFALLFCGWQESSFAQMPGGTGINPDYKDVEFAKVPSTKMPSLLLDIYLPKGVSAPFPTIVYVHPGGWSGGDKTDVARHVSYLTAAGFALVSINYRLSGDTVFPAPLHDCKAAIRWLKANAGRYNLNSNAIGVFGQSAGAHLASLVGVTANVKNASSGAVTMDLEGSVGGNTQYSSSVRAVADFFGPSNLVEFYKVQTQGSGSNLVGCTIPQCPDKANLASTTTYASRTAPPFLIMHGTADDVVPFSQSQLFDSTLRTVGAASTFIPVQGATHGSDPAWTKPDVQTTLINFFTQHLKNLTSVAIQEIAANNLLLSVSPNPAQELIVVKFTLITSERISLKLFNALGQEIAHILDETLPAGEHQKSLDISHWSLVSGAYFLQLQTNDQKLQTIPLQVIR
ncbi:MAG: alpha/beta hydrolase fold domain-containing protein [Candidatus Kapabacteria bacterium]|nr:alpha/beta hydrolase fold domain-containing protein [Candidatus Kapabacteria bacterium]